MERRAMPMSEESYVDKMLSDLVGVVHETQPTQTYPGDWFAAEQLRNSIERMEQTNDEARRQGFQWAEVLAPSKLYSDWPQLLQFKSNIDGIRQAFIGLCDEKLSYLGYLAGSYEAVPALASRFRAAIKNIKQVRDKYTAPLTAPKATVRL
ncbi:unnamed protein product [marine sediment metagenome]|uniref:Uncharacterized protein n=1 Tax=marine sediment metagenome TaxID=412755 RepID=X1DVA1_9ZZZZ